MNTDRDSRLRHGTAGHEAVLAEQFLHRRGHEKDEELFGGGALRALRHDNRALLDGRIEVARNDEIMAVGSEARGEGGGERDEAGVGVAGVDELRGLGDVFGSDDARLECVVELSGS